MTEPLGSIYPDITTMPNGPEKAIAMLDEGIQANRAAIARIEKEIEQKRAWMAKYEAEISGLNYMRGLMQAKLDG